MSTDATIQLRHPIVVRFRSSLFHTASKSKWKASTPGNYLFACALTKLNKITCISEMYYSYFLHNNFVTSIHKHTYRPITKPDRHNPLTDANCIDTNWSPRKCQK
uniref:Uncharacterized protein n=1 Tax=Triticum urartu TaxID=4572 RepID=A0A8R7US78_TRIUA